MENMDIARGLSTVVINGTSWSLAEAEQRATTLEDLWHPYILLYLLHCVACGVGAVMSLYTPYAYLVVNLLSGFSFLYSAITGAEMWGNKLGDFLWTGVFIKWLIVNLFATVPVLLLRARKMSPRVIKLFGYFVYGILGSNIIWTLGMESKGHIIVYINRVAGIMLVIALIMHCVAVCRAKPALDLFEVRSGFLYGFGTSLPWLVCYTVWNALFIAKITIGGLLQDILFWCLMAFYQYWDGHHLPIELYFAFARPVQLGTYIGFTEFLGTFVPYFYNSTTMSEHQPLPINSHAFFLFIAFANMLWSFVCTFWAGQRLVYGLGYFQHKFEEVHRDVPVTAEEDIHYEEDFFRKILNGGVDDEGEDEDEEEYE